MPEWRVEHLPQGDMQNGSRKEPTCETKAGAENSTSVHRLWGRPRAGLERALSMAKA